LPGAAGSADPTSFAPGIFDSLAATTKLRYHLFMLRKIRGMTIAWFRSRTRRNGEWAMSTTTATAASMPSGYLSNLKLASDERKRIWDSLTSERQAEAAAKFADPGTAVKEQKFSTLGDALAYDYSGTDGPTGANPRKLNADISIKSNVLTSDNGAKFGSLVNFDTMDSAVFLELKQGEYPTTPDASWIDDPTTKQKYQDAFQSRAYDAYKAAADKFGGFNSQTMLGYDSNANGYLDNETELFGFGTRGLEMSDFFDINTTQENGVDVTLADGSLSKTYELRSFTAADPATTTTDNIKIDPKRFMALTTEGKSASVIGTSYDNGSPGMTTTISLNLLSSPISSGTTAAISINVTTT
jgi:hypothetical protein